jgi:hypothetical protein
MTALRRTLVLLALPVTAVALAGPASAATPRPQATPGPLVTAAPTQQGIIMRDGGICDPIRHMGC